MRIVGRGHPSVRATHGKTFELTQDADITERATCVIAVGAVADPLHATAGAVRITIRAGAESFELHARANPGWDPSVGAVVRRSPVRTPGTLATHASASSADLPRAMVAALTDPSTEVSVEVDTEPGRPLVVLAMVDSAAPLDPRLAAEIAAADEVIAEDSAAARLIGGQVCRSLVEVDGRVLVVSCDDLPGRSVVNALGHVELETLGLSPALAAAAASPARGGVLLVAAGADPRAVLRTAAIGTRVVIGTTTDRVAALTTLAADLRTCAGTVVAAPDRPPIRVRVGETLPGRDAVQVCIEIGGGTGIDPSVRAAVSALLADGVPTKTAAKALAALAGWDKRRAYDAVLTWSDGSAH